MRPSGCRILPHGAPLHPEHTLASFGGLWKHSVLFGMSTGGVSTKAVRRSTKVHMLPEGAARAHAKCPPKAPPKHQKDNITSFVVFGSHMEAYGAIWRGTVFIWYV